MLPASSRKFKGCFKEVSKVYQGSLRESSRVFKESSKGVQVGLKGIASGFIGVSRVFERSSTGVLGKFQWYFKEVSKMCQGNFKSVSRKFL